MNSPISQRVSVINGRKAPEEGTLVGYGAIIEALKLPMPLPRLLAIISDRRRMYVSNGWRVFSSKIEIEDTLYRHLIFALKYEGVDLLFFKKLFIHLPEDQIIDLVTTEHTGIYSRKIWFLYEWLTGHQLPVPDLEIKAYIPLVDDALQYASTITTKSPRHRIKINLPGAPAFCPMVSRTPHLDDFINAHLDQRTIQSLYQVHPDVIHRMSAFLLLKDSQASFSIEKENPPLTRAIRWGRAIGEAGRNEITHEELYRLQQIIIEDHRFIKMGYRREGGFVGEHDRETGQPMPDHISARPEDLTSLMHGMMSLANSLDRNTFHPVLSAAMAAFGFVFIHPFVDGNGRLHRYLIHHLLAKTNFTPSGIIFPVSAAILIRLGEYKALLESYSLPLLDYISWQETDDHNVEVLNDTSDFYRYFDATPFAEFLFRCIQDTLDHIIPNEINYLRRFDAMSHWLKEKFEMPDKTIALLIRFLEQNQGNLSKRAREKEYALLSDEEVRHIESQYREIFVSATTF